MNLSNISNFELISRLERLAKTERKITHLVLWHIHEMEMRKLYAELGFGSMFEYLTKHLGYGESSAYRRIQSARLLKQIPHLAEKLEEGSLNLTQLTQVQKCLKEEKKKGIPTELTKTLEVLEKIENKSNFETQKVLALEFNQPVQRHEVLKPQQDHSVRLELYFTEEQMKILTEAKEFLSHSLPEGNWADLMTFLAKTHIEKIKGKEKPDETTKASVLTPLHSTQSFFIKPITKPKRKHLRLTTKRKLLAKADNCCEYKDSTSGRKCDSRYQLQVDHKVPLARGGNDNIENLRVLCRAHNLLMAKHWGLKRHL